jgi:hypothetical protein
MRTARTWHLAFLFLLIPSARSETPGRIDEDIWNTAFLEKAKAGFVHTTFRVIERDGKKLIRATSELRLKLLRNGQPIELRMENGDVEALDGEVVEVFMRQYQGEQAVLEMRGTIKDGQLVVNVTGNLGKNQRQFPWDKHAVGLYRQEQLYRQRQVKPGDEFSFTAFEPTINNFVVNKVYVKPYENVDVNGVEKRFLRVDIQPDKVQSVQLPGLTTWLNKDYASVVSSFEIPQLGKLVLVRGKGPVRITGIGPEIYSNSLIPVQRIIERPNDTQSIVYRITVRDDDEPAKTFAIDDRQKCLSAKGNQFDLEVRAKSQPSSISDAKEPPAEYLKSCHFIDSDDAAIQKYAKQATQGAKDPWNQALRIERWVHNTMNVSFAENFAPASEVARTKRGDCRQHALLATAMCRAAGIPARTALGLVYAIDRDRGPIMAFHMWTEVWVHGQWLAFDATRGEGRVGAGHLKITDSSWANMQSLEPLLPVIRVLGKLSIEIVSVDAG